MDLRPPSIDHAPDLEDLINASTLEDVGMVVYRSGDLLREWGEGEPYEQHLVAFDESGAPEGLLWVEEEDRSIYFELYLSERAPDVVATSLIRAIEERAGSRARRTGSELELETSSGNASTTGLLEDGGYQIRKTHLAMMIELDGVPDADWPDGTRLRPYSEGADDELFYTVLRNGFGKRWDGPEEWSEWFRKHRSGGYVPELWFFAEGNESILGAVHSRDMWENDVATGWVRNLAVLPSARRRGIGRALLLESFRRLAERGRRRAVLGVEETNASAVRFYGAVGMQARGRSADLFKKVAAPSKRVRR